MHTPDENPITFRKVDNTICILSLKYENILIYQCIHGIIVVKLYWPAFPLNYFPKLINKPILIFCK